MGQLPCPCSPRAPAAAGADAVSSCVVAVQFFVISVRWLDHCSDGLHNKTAFFAAAALQLVLGCSCSIKATHSISQCGRHTSTGTEAPGPALATHRFAVAVALPVRSEWSLWSTRVTTLASTVISHNQLSNHSAASIYMQASA